MIVYISGAHILPPPQKKRKKDGKSHLFPERLKKFICRNPENSDFLYTLFAANEENRPWKMLINIAHVYATSLATTLFPANEVADTWAKLIEIYDKIVPGPVFLMFARQIPKLPGF